jgi:uncharacterized membrane protein YfcA
MPAGLTDLAVFGSGGLVGAILGLVGGGGSVLAVPLLVYGVGVSSPHLAIGTSALAVSVSALTNLAAHARAGNVKWGCASVFTFAGVLGAALGSSVAKVMDGHRLLALFGAMMIVIGFSMLRTPRRPDRSDVRLSRETAAHLAPRLIGLGAGVGVLSGFFGIGGGFLVVPALIFATSMPMIAAVGSSLVSVATFGATTGVNYALSGLVDMRIAALFIVGGVLGGFLGVALGGRLAQRKHALRVIFALGVIVVGLYVVARGAAPLLHNL